MPIDFLLIYQQVKKQQKDEVKSLALLKVEKQLLIPAPYLRAECYTEPLFRIAQTPTTKGEIKWLTINSV